MKGLDHNDLLDPKAANDLDKIVRSRLKNWGAWQRLLLEPKPKGFPSPHPMFLQMASGYNEENDSSRRNKDSANVDDAMLVESMICEISEHSKSVIFRYFVKDQNSIVCSKKARVSERQFNNWLNRAIGEVTTIMFSEAKRKKK